MRATLVNYINNGLLVDLKASDASFANAQVASSQSSSKSNTDDTSSSSTSHVVIFIVGGIVIGIFVVGVIGYIFKQHFRRRRRAPLHESNNLSFQNPMYETNDGRGGSRSSDYSNNDFTTHQDLGMPMQQPYAATETSFDNMAFVNPTASSLNNPLYDSADITSFGGGYTGPGGAAYYAEPDAPEYHEPDSVA